LFEIFEDLRVLKKKRSEKNWMKEKRGNRNPNKKKRREENLFFF